MANITLDGNDYDHVIDVGFTETNTVALPEWINDETPDINADIWNLEPLKIIYTLRVTQAEKWVLDQVLTGHSSIKLTDATYGITDDDVFMIGLKAEWIGLVNSAGVTIPWKVTIELIVV